MRWRQVLFWEKRDFTRFGWNFRARLHSSLLSPPSLPCSATGHRQLPPSYSPPTPRSGTGARPISSSSRPTPRAPYSFRRSARYRRRPNRRTPSPIHTPRPPASRLPRASPPPPSPFHPIRVPAASTPSANSARGTSISPSNNLLNPRRPPEIWGSLRCAPGRYTF
jgi:hypothetical protein